MEADRRGVHGRPLSVVLRLALGAAVVVLVANLAIVGVSALIAWRSPPAAPTLAGPVPGVRNLAVVDARLWRGSAPDLAGYQASPGGPAHGNKLCPGADQVPAGGDFNSHDRDGPSARRPGRTVRH